MFGKMYKDIKAWRPSKPTRFTVLYWVYVFLREAVGWGSYMLSFFLIDMRGPFIEVLPIWVLVLIVLQIVAGVIRYGLRLLNDWIYAQMTMQGFVNVMQNSTLPGANKGSIEIRMGHPGASDYRTYSRHYGEGPVVIKGTEVDLPTTDTTEGS